jgi:hypothetical protein
MHSRSRPATTVVFHLQDAQDDLDIANILQDIHLELLRAFDDVIGEIVDVWAPFSIRTELI